MIHWAFAAGTLLVAFSFRAGATEVEPGARSAVEIRVQVIAASSHGAGVDPKLLPLRNRLKDFSFSSYRLLSEQTFTLGLNTQETIALPDRRTLEITPRKFERSGEIRVHLHVRSARQEKLVDAEYAIEPGGVLLVGGLKHDDGTLLIALHHAAAR